MNPELTATTRDQINAIYQAQDALRQLLGELSGRLDHDPEATDELRTAACVLLGTDLEPATVGAAAVVLENENRRLTVSADVRVSLGELFTVVTVEDDWTEPDEDTKRDLDSSIPMSPDEADRLADALHAAAIAARAASNQNR